MPRAVVNGVGIEYLAQGGGTETVALLNGIAMSIAHWKPVADRLAQAGYRVVMHDLRGQLLSERPEGPYSFEEHASDLAELLRQLGVGKAHVVGTSYGAEVAMTFARDFPGICASVTSVDGVSEYDAVLGAAIEAWKTAALADPRTFYKSIIPWNYSASYITSNKEPFAAREEAIAALPRDYFKAFGRLCDAFMRLDLTKDLGKIRCPCLVVVADGDLLKPRRYSKIIADGVPGAVYEEISGAGHAVVVEKPDEVSAMLLRFLGTAR